MRAAFNFFSFVLVILTVAQCICAKKVVESFQVRSDIRYRFATTQISSVIRNVDSTPQEISFDPTVPKKAFIVAFHMDIDGTRYTGHVEERLRVQKEDQASLSKNHDVTYPRHAPRRANIFEVSVNVSPGSAVNFTLTYQELLRRRMGFYDYGLYISPGQPVEDLRVEVEIHENRPLTFVRTPALKSDSVYTGLLSHFDSVNLNELTTISRPSPKSARVMYQPSLDQQGGASGSGLSAMFSVQYDLEYGSPQGDVLVSDGYFVHFVTPPKAQRSLPKDIVFVLDESGSMMGRKWEQLVKAMTTILSQLKSEDRFNVITFSSESHRWRARLANVKNATVKHAKGFVQSKFPFGGTNINDTLLTALSQFKIKGSKERVEMIFFLTDGLATEGEIDTVKIAENVLNANKRRVAIFSLAFGKGADYVSLRSLSAQNFGFATKIYEESDAAQQVYSLYEDISSISVKTLKVKYRKDTVDELSLTQRNFPIVFSGTEVVIAGQLETSAKKSKYKIAGMVTYGHPNISARVRAADMFVVSPERASGQFSSLGPGDNTSLVERMCAFEAIKQLLALKEKHANDTDKTKELDEKISTLSLQYQYVSHQTSMKVKTPDQDEATEMRNLELPSTSTDPDDPTTSLYLRLVTLTLNQDANTSKSICMVPRRWTYGNIVLLSGEKIKVVLKQCSRKLCPVKPTLEGLMLKSGSSSTEIYFDLSGKWVYRSIPYISPAFVVTGLSDTVLQVSGSGLTAVLDWTKQNETAGYRVKLTVNGTIPHGGLFGDLEAQPGSRLQELTRKATKKAKRLCSGEKTDFIAMIFDKRARRYSVYRLNRGKKPAP